MNAYRAGSTLGIGLTLTTALVLGAAPALGQDERLTMGSAGTVIAPSEAPLGASYADWGVGWWQWLLNVPPIEDPEVGDCQAGQGGEVFYIPHVPPGMAVTTDCTVAPDQWILASAGGTFWDSSDGSVDTSDELLSLVEADIPLFSEPAVIVDGEEVADIASYWVVNPAFTIEYAEGNVFGLPTGSWDAAMGGWFVMIPPLEPGSHTIVVRDAVDMGDGTGPQTAELTANLTVEAAEAMEVDASTRLARNGDVVTEQDRGAGGYR